MLTVENQVTIDSKKLKKLFKRSNQNTEKVLHGMISIAYEKAPLLKSNYKNQRWDDLVADSKYIYDIYGSLVSKDIEKEIVKLNKLASKKAPCVELDDMVCEMEYLSKEVMGDVEKYIHKD